MRRTVFAIVVLAVVGLQAQVLNVNNNNGTYLPLETETIKEITFDAARKIVTLEARGGIFHSFYAPVVESISPNADKNNRLYYDLNPVIEFDSNDKNTFKEVIETIEEDTNADEYGDFVEHYAPTVKVDIVFSETGVAVSGTVDGIACSSNGGHLVVDSSKGKVKYNVKGKCGNGSLKIYSTKKFQLVLDSLDLTNPAGPAINIQSGKTVYFTLKENSVNSLCDGSIYSAPLVDFATGEEEDQKGTLFSEGQLIFSGNGTLNVTSHGGHAVCSDDYIIIRSGNINIHSDAKDGFHTNDKFMISRTKDLSPVITVKAGANGIDCGKGEVIINAGRLDIETVGEAIKVEYEEAEPDPAVVPNATINGGYINLVTTGSKSSGIKTTGEYRQTGGVIHATVRGDGSKVLNCDANVTITDGKLVGISHGTVFENSTSVGGVKCVGNVYISGGTIAFNCLGKGSKGINNDAILNIIGGSVTIVANAGNFSGTDGVVRKSIAVDTGNMYISNGTLLLCAYEEAVSATSLILNGGNLHAVSKKNVAVDATVTQKAGWFLTKGAE